MLSPKAIASSALVAVLLCSSSSSAAPHFFSNDLPRLDSRQESSSSVNASSILEPVVPPEVIEDDLSTLLLATDVSLTWAGSAGTDAETSSNGTSSKRMLKRDGAVFTRGEFKFRYPSVPLDHSAFVSGVSCTGNTLTGTLTSKAYTFAKKQWTGVGDIVYVTSVDGCGLTAANDYFHATSITFSDSAKTFTATGSSAEIKDVASHMNLKWGDVGTTTVKRAADKTQVISLPPVSLSPPAPLLCT
jgi:hypothetical protein